MRVEFRGWVIPASVGVASFAAGALAGHLWTKRKYRINPDVIQERFEENVNQLQFHFEENADKMNSLLQQTDRVVRNAAVDRQNFLDRFAGPEEAAVIAAKDDHPSNGVNKGTLAAVPNNEEDDEMMVTIFTEEDDDWDYDEEVAARTPNDPYIIHRDEYFSNEMDFSQDSLMYYEGDNILCDEHDVPVYNPEKIVGKLIFGHGSRDPNICYVRNERLMSEYEVLLDHGYYQTEVLGQEVEKDIRHSHRVLKFREE